MERLPRKPLPLDPPVSGHTVLGALSPLTTQMNSRAGLCDVAQHSVQQQQRQHRHEDVVDGADVADLEELRKH